MTAELTGAGLTGAGLTGAGLTGTGLTDAGLTGAGLTGAGLTGSGRPALANHVRLILDSARDRHVLLSPETVVVLNATSADILRLCDGRRTVDEIVAELRRRYDAVADDEVRAFLTRMTVKQWVGITDG